MCLISKWSSKIDNFLASNSQIPHVVLHLMLLLHEALSSARYSHFHQIWKPWCFIRCSSIFSALLVPYTHRWHFKVPGSFDVPSWVCMSWISYHYELFNSLPCSDSKSHSSQEKNSLTLCSRLTRFSISLLDMALHSQSSQFIIDY